MNFFFFQLGRLKKIFSLLFIKAEDGNARIPYDNFCKSQSPKKRKLYIFDDNYRLHERRHILRRAPPHDHHHDDHHKHHSHDHGHDHHDDHHTHHHPHHPPHHPPHPPPKGKKSFFYFANSC
jgi:hypothetical protein